LRGHERRRDGGCQRVSEVPKRQHSLGGRVVLYALLPMIAIALAAAGLAHLTEDIVLGAALALLLGLPLLALALRRSLAPTLSLMRALSGTIHSLRDGDFSTSLGLPRERELAELVGAHNALGDVLREERQRLGQRELLLDTVVQNTPVALVLCEPRGRIVYANLAARQLFGGGRRLEGQTFDALLETAPTALREAIASEHDQLVALELDGEEETYHVSARGFRLNGRPHRLSLFRRLTRELARQEVAAWKKVIRVISHELNNSLAPISSLAHSGAELARRGEIQRLPQVFATIEERARHLDGFIRGYASFAKLPAPRVEEVAWGPFLERLRGERPFVIDGQLPTVDARFDPSQLGQALLNLLKNAAESGSPTEHIALGIRRVANGWRIDVLDRGSGMSDAVLANALLPFYSTKRSGTGLGLALAREIIEAHGGRIALGNRADGGLAVSLTLPA